MGDIQNITRSLLRPICEIQFIKRVAFISYLTLWVEMDGSSWSGLVSVGLSVSGQRSQFAQINDGSLSSVSNKVMGTDTEGRQGARHRQRGS